MLCRKPTSHSLFSPDLAGTNTTFAGLLAGDLAGDFAGDLVGLLAGLLDAAAADCADTQQIVTTRNKRAPPHSTQLHRCKRPAETQVASPTTGLQWHLRCVGSRACSMHRIWTTADGHVTTSAN